MQAWPNAVLTKNICHWKFDVDQILCLITAGLLPDSYTILAKPCTREYEKICSCMRICRPVLCRVVTPHLTWSKQQPLTLFSCVASSSSNYEIAGAPTSTMSFNSSCSSIEFYLAQTWVIVFRIFFILIN